MTDQKKDDCSLDDARGYLEEYFVPLMGEIPDEGQGGLKAIDILHDVFNSGEVKGKRLIDVGSGPTIYQIISASRVFPEIVCAEYSESGRAEIQKWVAEDPGAFDWSEYVQYFCDFEGTRDIWAERQKQLRQAITAVVPCDVHKSNPVEPLQLEPFDAVMTLYCIETACTDRKSYVQAVRNVSSLLKPGGTLILQTYIGTLRFLSNGASFYAVGGVRHPTVKLDVDFVLQTISDAGYEDIKCSYYPAAKRERYTTSDLTAILHLTAKKI
ncbi:PREDICTED: indolethylamine N-methyltransferase-like [Branchiostoma belcheri]|uniref:Indolethylamine N-methyltransferase-like n=1 Tax=Branchiostoma belcheri TaxID=7741 RepID=A0A6P4Y082_BRABE|nr:PREDICTED: indolethylamine N-methyltransferase-like [Branchiostoma belcheri]